MWYKELRGVCVCVCGGGGGGGEYGGTDSHEICGYGTRNSLEPLHDISFFFYLMDPYLLAMSGKTNGAISVK